MARRDHRRRRPAVTELNLRENNLSGGISSGLDQLASLERLDLQGNDLTGSIPSELGNLANLQRLDLDQNSLTGVLPVQLGALVDLVKLDLDDNLLTGTIPSELGMLTNLENIELSENAFTGCIPAALRTVADNDLVELALPFCGVSPAQAFTTAQLEALFDEIISKTEQREAFSEIKESNIGFSAIEDMKALRSEFVASTTETDLYYALSKLSNARRDSHLRIYPVDGGLTAPNRASCVAAPVHVLPDLSDISGPTFFVAEVGEGLASPEVGDVIVGVNGRSMAEYMNEFTPRIRHSSLQGLYWRMAYELPAQVATVPPSLYSGQLDLTLENSSGQRYDVTLPYNRACGHFGLTAGYPGFVEVMRRENFNVLIDGNRQMILLQWLDFEYSLIQDIIDLMEYAEREQILNYDMIIDVTFSGGGSRGAYAIQRLVDRPFRVTFGNVRLSDLGKARIERYVNQEPDTAAPDIFGLNLSRSWLIDWARTDATEAIRRGDDYTPAVPFKLAHLPKDSDGILQPAPVRFSGEVAIINARTWGGSHLDQFMAMFVDNDLATFIGVPTGGYSNTWEGIETLRMPETDAPLARFMWSIGHTLRPNGDVLEGNPAQPDVYIPLTRDNFQGYHRMLFDRAIGALDGGSSSVAQRGIEFIEGEATTRFIPENITADINVGLPIFADGEASSYTMSGADAESFEIIPDTGQVRTKAGVVYDYETQNRYSVTVGVADDHGNRDAIVVSIRVLDVASGCGVLRNLRTNHSDERLTVRWSRLPDRDGTARVLGYQTEIRRGDSGLWTHRRTHLGPSIEAMIYDGLDNGVDYQVRARAVDIEEDCEWLPPIWGMPTDVLTPRYPTDRFGTQIIGVPGRNWRFLTEERCRYADGDVILDANCLYENTGPDIGAVLLAFDDPSLGSCAINLTYSTLTTGSFSDDCFAHSVDVFTEFDVGFKMPSLPPGAEAVPQPSASDSAQRVAANHHESSAALVSRADGIAAWNINHERRPQILTMPERPNPLPSTQTQLAPRNQAEFEALVYGRGEFVPGLCFGRCLGVNLPKSGTARRMDMISGGTGWWSTLAHMNMHGGSHGGSIDLH